MIYIDLTEVNQNVQDDQIQQPEQEWSYKNYFGLVIFKDHMKSHPIEYFLEKMKITENYVMGYDEKLSVKKEPHYHIHFLSEKTFSALQSHKKRSLEGFGHKVKLYQAKDIPPNDVNVWMSYAVKENLMYISENLNKEEIMKQAHAQAMVKKHKVNFGEKAEKKKEEKKTFEQKLFEGVDKFYTGGFFDTAKHVSRISLDDLETFLTITRVEYYTWKYLLVRKHITHTQYLESFQHKYNNLGI